MHILRLLDGNYSEVQWPVQTREENGTDEGVRVMLDVWLEDSVQAAEDNI